ncbi:hypothetical protein FHS36_003737 [Streptomyces eurocidicus]|uniref:Uncharacterized protein n=1 Tax=Streptomyces eurocidicus TaxID=66423 RepID=A0A7W8BBG8_STREU|nr:hypothetical protein [Streptomyces eurocidicus]
MPEPPSAQGVRHDRSSLRRRQHPEARSFALNRTWGLIRPTRDAQDRLWLSEEGEQAHVALARNAPAIRAAFHEGIDDADYVTTVKVLQRLIRNAGGTVA